MPKLRCIKLSFLKSTSTMYKSRRRSLSQGLRKELNIDRHFIPSESYIILGHLASVVNILLISSETFRASSSSSSSNTLPLLETLPIPDRAQGSPISSKPDRS